MRLTFLTLQYDPTTVASYVGAGTSLLGDIFNLFGSSKANREQRDYNTQILNQQRQWALQDIKDQNAYNSPVEQMNRLKQAKLNPNMVYGTGVTGSTGQQSSQPRPVSSPSYNPQNTLAAFANMGQQMASAIATLAGVSKIQPEIGQIEASTQQTLQNTANLKSQKVMQDTLNYIRQIQPDYQGITQVINGKETYVSPEDWVAHLAGVDLQSREAQLQLQKLGITTADVNNAILQALKQSTITQGLEAAKQSIIQTGINEQQKKNLELAFSGMQKSQSLQDLEIEFRNKNFGNNPILQQLFKTFLTGGLMLIP